MGTDIGEPDPEKSNMQAVTLVFKTAKKWNLLMTIPSATVYSTQSSSFLS
jgi:hypothetical protein